MWPNVPAGSIIVVKQWIPISEYEIGDIVAFRAKSGSNHAETVMFIKRIVAEGGDTVQMVSGRLVVNGKPLPRDATKPMSTTDHLGKNETAPCYMETDREAKYKICEIDGDHGYYDNTPKYVVPKDAYFLMGDNRDNSDDSRDMDEIGYVSSSNLVGKVNFVLKDVWQ